MPRHQNLHLRTGLLAEPVPQVRFEAAARVSVVDGLPTFALPVLAGSTGEAIDSGSLSFLVRQTLSEREKEKRKEEEEEEVAKHMAVGGCRATRARWSRRARGERGRRGGIRSCPRLPPLNPRVPLTLLAPGSLDVLLRAPYIWRSCSVSWCYLRSISECFRIPQFLGFTVDTVHALVAGAFGYYFTYFCVKVDLGT